MVKTATKKNGSWKRCGKVRIGVDLAAGKDATACKVVDPKKPDGSIRPLEANMSPDLQKMLVSLTKPSRDPLELEIEFAPCNIRVKVKDIVRGMFHHKPAMAKEFFSETLGTLPLGTVAAIMRDDLKNTDCNGIPKSALRAAAEYAAINGPYKC